jgi:hypothetical protein
MPGRSVRPHHADRAIPLDEKALDLGTQRVLDAFSRILARLPLDDVWATAKWFAENRDRGTKPASRQYVPLTPFFDVPWKTVRGWPLDSIRVTPVLIHAPKNVPYRLPVIHDAHMNASGRRDASVYVRVNVASPDITELRDHPEKFFPIIRSKLLHELTHVRDYIRERDVIDPSEDLRGYFNSPHEVRAYMQQIIDDVLRVAPSLQEKAYLSRTPNELVVEGSLSESLAWNKIERFLNATNRARILKNVVLALSDRGLLHSRRPRLPA